MKKTIKTLSNQDLEYLSKISSQLRVYPGAVETWLEKGVIVADYKGRGYFSCAGRAHCDKCGRMVEAKNSARLVTEMSEGSMGFASDRHLFPESECEGSPSTVKLIEVDSDYAESRRVINEVVSLFEVRYPRQ